MTRNRFVRTCLFLSASLIVAQPINLAFAVQLNPANLGRSGQTVRVAHSILIPYKSKSSPAANDGSDTDIADPSLGMGETKPKVMFRDFDSATVANQLMQASHSSRVRSDHHHATTDVPPPVQTLDQVAKTSPSPTIEQSSHSPSDIDVVIHAPRTRPDAPNRHVFRIENVGQANAHNLLFSLGVPDPVQIVEVVPFHTVVVDRTARFRIKKIPAGKSIEVEILTTPNVDQKIVFESDLAFEDSNPVVAHTAAHPNRVRALPPLPNQIQLQTPAQSHTKHQAIPSTTSRSNRSLPSINHRVEFDAIATEPEHVTGLAANRNQVTPVAQPANVQPANQERELWRNHSETSFGSFRVGQGRLVQNPWVDNSSSATVSAPEQPVTHFPRSRERIPLKTMVASQPIETQQRTNPQTKLLQATIEGPQHAVAGEEAEYTVTVQNSTGNDADAVLVQLQIPAGLQITVLDRDAWFDGDAKTVTWQLPNLASGKAESIRYLAKITSTSGQVQRVTLGMRNKFQGQVSFKTTVMNQYELAAPLLPFEKDANSLK